MYLPWFSKRNDILSVYSDIIISSPETTLFSGLLTEDIHHPPGFVYAILHN